MIDRKELAKTNRRIMSFLNPAIKKEPTMKTIYLEAEVVLEYNDMTLIKISGQDLELKTKDLDQAQVLAVEDYKKIVEDLAEWSRKYPRGRIYGMNRQPDMDVELIRLEERAKELTELVRSKERTLEGLFIELRESHQERDTEKFDFVMEEIREQLLKNRE